MENNNNIEKQAENIGTEKKKKKKSGKLGRKILAGILAVSLVTGVTFVGTAKVFSSYPVAIMIDSKPVCYLASRDEAEKVISKVVKRMSVKGSDIKAVTNDNRLEIDRADTMDVDPAKQMSVKEAVKYLTDRDNLKTASSESEDDTFKMTVVSTKIVDRNFTPEPVYEADETMLAGTKVIKTENKDGKERVLIVYTTENGKITEKDETLIETLEEGTSEVIVKGTLGLPDGADWKTYDGDPVYNNGEELIETAKKYIGTGYKLGSANLAKGVSCIGLVKAIYAKYGVYIPMSMTGARKVGIAVSYKNMKKGDIICYSNHFALYAGNGKILDSRSRGGVGIRSLNSVGQKVLTVRRIVKN